MSTMALGGGAAAVQFDESEPYEKGFARVFGRDIAPGLAALEKERPALERTPAHALDPGELTYEQAQLQPEAV